MAEYSVIIPVYNEAETLRPLWERLEKVISGTGKDFEVIFVNDGSSDGSLAIIDEISVADPRVKYISFGANKGKSAVYSAAFQYASGNVIITIDADLQDHPEEIPALIEKLKEYDLVIGRKSGRLKNEPLKSIPSKFFNLLKRLIFGLVVHDSNCGLKAMKREVTENLRLYGDLYRFIAEMSCASGFKITEIPVAHSPRLHGKSKYGMSRFNTGLMDILTVRFLISFSTKPLHFFGGIALLLLLAGGGLEIYALAMKISGSDFRTHMAAIIIGIMLIIIGVQLLCVGLLGEMFVRFSQNPGKFRISRKKGFDD
ncbi:MAG: glycosyltransferase family 2 protein [Victivallaceae bacterium]|nr:glycosyltransferase family 2 protein [Victivallaceae bacterium]